MSRADYVNVSLSKLDTGNFDNSRNKLNRISQQDAGVNYYDINFMSLFPIGLCICCVLYAIAIPNIICTSKMFANIIII